MKVESWRESSEGLLTENQMLKFGGRRAKRHIYSQRNLKAPPICRWAARGMVARSKTEKERLRDKIVTLALPQANGALRHSGFSQRSMSSNRATEGPVNASHGNV